MKSLPLLPILVAGALTVLTSEARASGQTGPDTPGGENIRAHVELASLRRPDVNRAEWQNLVFRQLYHGTALVRERHHRLDRAIYA